MATVLQIVGMIAVTIGAGLIAIPAGLIVGGVFCLVAGFALGNS